MNRIRRICHSLIGLQRRVGVLLASSGVAPAVLAADPPLPPPGRHQHPPPLPARTHTVVVGGMPSWQITLITVGAALLAGALAVLVGRARVARVPYAQISARLGIPVGGIGPTRGRCLDKLRRHPAIAALINAEAQAHAA